jgi:dihydroneopterin triphosphate diphosphatase
MNIRHDIISVYVARPAAGKRSHEFLQLLRRADDYLGASWQTIYGSIDAGETLWQGALREMREETSLTPREFYRLGSVQSFYTPGNDTVWHCTSFCALIDREQIVTLNDEHTDFRWVPRDAADGLFMWPSDRVALRECVELILSDSPARPLLKIELR